MGRAVIIEERALVSSDKGHLRHGELSTLAKYPEQPTERVYCNTLSQCPRYKVRESRG